jgi:hypothetical protein
MASYIVSPGGAASLTTSPPILTLTTTITAGGAGDFTTVSADNLVIASLQDVTISNANDIFTWTQLNNTGKNQIATTSTNSVSSNLVVDGDTYFGATGTTGSAIALGIQGLSTGKTRVGWKINIGDKTLTGLGYVTGLSPTVSADSPVWVTPVTITVDGDITIAAA